MKYRLQIRVGIRPENMNYGSGLEVNEEIEIEASNFMEICEVLAKFHDLSNALRKAKK